jgi:hypothetical protein
MQKLKRLIAVALITAALLTSTQVQAANKQTLKEQNIRLSYKYMKATGLHDKLWYVSKIMLVRFIGSKYFFADDENGDRWVIEIDNTCKVKKGTWIIARNFTFGTKTELDDFTMYYHLLD